MWLWRQLQADVLADVKFEADPMWILKSHLHGCFLTHISPPFSDYKSFLFPVFKSFILGILRVASVPRTKSWLIDWGPPIFMGYSQSEDSLCILLGLYHLHTVTRVLPQGTRQFGGISSSQDAVDPCCCTTDTILSCRFSGKNAPVTPAKPYPAWVAQPDSATPFLSPCPASPSYSILCSLFCVS